MLNLWLVDRLLGWVVARFIFSHVCWQVLSPGAEINQNSVMVTQMINPKNILLEIMTECIVGYLRITLVVGETLHSEIWYIVFNIHVHIGFLYVSKRKRPLNMSNKIQWLVLVDHVTYYTSSFRFTQMKSHSAL